MTFRATANLLFLVFSIVVASSFVIGGYLMSRSGRQVASASVPAAPSAEELIAQAAEHLNAKRTEQALFAYRRALSLNPRSLEAQIGLARGELMAGREAEAAREYERALKLEPKNPSVLMALARIYSHQARSWSLAETKFKQYLALQPTDADAQLGLARILALRGRALEATDIFARPPVSKIMTVRDREDYAFALVKSGQTGQAEVVLKQLLASGRQDARLRLQLASIYAARRDWDSALPIYRSLLEQNPDDSLVNLTYGLGLLSVKRYREALDPLRRASRAMPSSGEAGLGYARALKGVNDLNTAADEFQRVLPLYRGNAAITREYADLLLEKKDYKNSERHYKDALALGVREARLYVGLSGALRGNRKPREALPYLEHAYALEPTDRLAFELARLLQQVGRSEQALALLSTVERRSVRASTR